MLKNLLIGAALALTLAGPAAAVDFTTKIVQIDGKTAMKTAENGPDLTLADVAKIALLSAYPDEASLSGTDKNKRFWLARKIETHPKDPPLDLDETKLIKDLIAKAYNPLVMGQAWAILDPGSIPK